MSKSKAWMQRHVGDPFVKRARSEGYRSRAAYKLIELLDKDRLVAKGAVVVDLGAAPGSWSQVLAGKIGPGGCLIALDILPMEPIQGVSFIQGDFRENSVLGELEQALDGRQVDLVVSDMAPNISGVAAMDQARTQHLCELALDFARNHLTNNGYFLIKTFQGSGYPGFLQEMRRSFQTVLTRKPGASRGQSSEMYVVGKGRK